jgi:DNA-binding MarR family transcriptional regulator
MLEALFHFQNSQLTPTQIASFIHLSKSSITACIDSLEHKGYVVRDFHVEDRRKVVVSLTQKGKLFCEQMLPLIYEHIEETWKI